jgi:hypothetical protein
MVGPLPTYCEDPVERLRIVSKAMEGLKESKQALGAEAIARLEDFAPPTLFARASRLHFSTRLYNLLVTNVPGPQFPLYLLGRELEEFIPVAFLAPNQALAIAIVSYNGSVKIGLIGDYDAMPDLDQLGGLVEDALAELLDTARSGPLSVADEPLEQAVEAHRALGHRAVAAAVEDHQLGVAQVVLELECVGGRDHPVAAAPHDQGWDAHLLEPVEDVVAEQVLDRREEARRVDAVAEELPQQLGAHRERVVEQAPEGRPAHPRAPHRADSEVEGERGGGSRDPGHRLRGLAANAHAADARRGHQHEPVHPVGLANRHLG